MATRVIDDSKLQDIAVAIQGKDGGSTMTVDQMPTRIASIPMGEPIVQNPVLVLMDWEGTILKEYSKEDALALTELPAPSSLSKYADVDHEFLLFQEWNWSLADIKTFVQNRPDERLLVVAIYTTTDGQDHNYWDNPRLEGDPKAIVMQKRATAYVNRDEFRDCKKLKYINIPKNTTYIGQSAFNNCNSLKFIGISDGFTSLIRDSFSTCSSLKNISLPRGLSSFGAYVFSSSYLESIVLPDTLTNLDGYVFTNCISLKKLIVPDSITTFGTSSFMGCNKLMYVNTPTNLSEIAYRCFRDCYVLESFALPETLASVEEEVFRSCFCLTKMAIPESVTIIKSSAFYDCRNLCDFVLFGKPELSDVNAFKNTHANLLFYVPRENLSWFETATNWSTYYANNKIVAIEEHISYLESIGINVDDYKEVAA